MIAQEIIEKIRAEVERLKNDRAFLDDNQQLAYWEGLNKVSEKLSDLEKEEKPSEHKDIDTEIGHWMSRLDDKYCMLVNHYSIQDIKDTARHFYELGCRRTAEKYDEIEYKRQKAEESVPNDIEEAAENIYKTTFGTRAEDFKAGAEWQKEQMMKEAEKPCHTVEEWMEHIKNADALTKAIFSKGPYNVLYDALNHPYRDCYDAIKEFGELCYQTAREDMMKEAVESEVTETCGISSVWIKTKQFKPGQKVKIIIVKED